MVSIKTSQLGGAEVLLGSSIEFLIDAAEACKEAGDHEAKEKLYQLAEDASAVIERLRQRRIEGRSEQR